MRFLRDIDYNAQIRNEIVAVLKHGKNFTLHDAEAIAQSQIEGMLQSRYNVAAIFSPLLPYSPTQSYEQNDRVTLVADAYNAQTEYLVNDLVAYQDKVYKCIALSTGNAPTEIAYFTIIGTEHDIYSITAESAEADQIPSESDDYLLGDTRHRYLVALFVDVTLYHLHSNITPRNVPEVRNTRYKEAIKALEMAERGKRNYGLPILENKEQAKYRLSKNTPLHLRW